MLKDESEISRQARWQRKHRAMGLCVLCSRPAFKGWRCKKHYEQHKITMRLRYIPKVRGRYKVGGTSVADSGSKRGAKKTATAKRATTAKKTTAKKRTTRAATAKKTGRSKATAKASTRASARKKSSSAGGR